MSQQLVPPFNKKEVKELAVEGVNEGIAEGKVNIPAGGTKLYLHEIVLDQVSPASQTTIYVITTKPDKFYKVFGPNRFTSEGLIVSFLNIYDEYVGWYYNRKSFADCYHFDSEGNVTRVQYGNYDFTSDTVTEL